MDAIQKTLLEQIADLHEVPEGAFNLRVNGQTAERNVTANIDIVPKEDEPGIDIIIKPGTKKESVHIPVLLSKTGIRETVYNDFYIGEDCDVTIVAGCGIHNGGDAASEHSGIHRFFIGKNAKIGCAKCECKGIAVVGRNCKIADDTVIAGGKIVDKETLKAEGK